MLVFQPFFCVYSSLASHSGGSYSLPVSSVNHIPCSKYSFNASHGIFLVKDVPVIISFDLRLKEIGDWLMSYGNECSSALHSFSSIVPGVFQNRTRESIVI